jgi:hypothetical protein
LPVFGLVLALKLLHENKGDPPVPPIAPARIPSADAEPPGEIQLELCSLELLWAIRCFFAKAMLSDVADANVPTIIAVANTTANIAIDVCFLVILDTVLIIIKYYYICIIYFILLYNYRILSINGSFKFIDLYYTTIYYYRVLYINPISLFLLLVIVIKKLK